MKALLLIPLATLLVGCQTPQTPPKPLACAGGDGSSCEQAVVLTNARYIEAAMLAEKLWLDQKYPGRHEAKQSALSSVGKHFDLVELTTADGQTLKVYFDTTECFPK